MSPILLFAQILLRINMKSKGHINIPNYVRSTCNKHHIIAQIFKIMMYKCIKRILILKLTAHFNYKFKYHQYKMFSMIFRVKLNYNLFYLIMAFHDNNYSCYNVTSWYYKSKSIKNNKMINYTKKFNSKWKTLNFNIKCYSRNKYSFDIIIIFYFNNCARV